MTSDGYQRIGRIMEHTTIDELGNVTVTYEENPRDPLCLESIRNGFAHVDRDLERQGLHWERIVVSGRGYCIYEQAPPIVPRTDPFFVCIALSLKEGQKPTREQIFIMDHFVAQCRRALGNYEEDGTLPTEELAKYLGRKGVKTEPEELKELLGIDIVKFGPTYCIRQEDGKLVPWLSHPQKEQKQE